MDIGAIQSGGWDIGALQFVPSGGGTVYEETVTISRSSSILSGVNAMFKDSIDLSKSI